MHARWRGSEIMRLYLFRHGAVAERELYFGQYDNALSPDGERQSQAIADALADLDLAAVYTSDLTRSADTGRRIQRRTGMPFAADARLRELHLGWADGMSRDEAHAREPRLADRRYDSLVEAPFTDGGESVPALAARARAFLREIASRHRGRKVAVVAHNTTNRVFIGDALGLPLEHIFSFRQDFGCLNIIEYGESRARLALLNADPLRYQL
jgi:alpha-ribazole phosphatase